MTLLDSWERVGHLKKVPLLLRKGGQSCFTQCFLFLAQWLRHWAAVQVTSTFSFFFFFFPPIIAAVFINGPQRQNTFGNSFNFTPAPKEVFLTEKDQKY